MKASCLRCEIVAVPYLAEVEDIEEPMLIDAIAEASRVASIAPILPGKHTSSKQHERSEVRASLQIVNRPRCIVHSVVQVARKQSLPTLHLEERALQSEEKERP